MIFALYDYYHYKKRSGRYGRDIKNGPMSAAWENGIPDRILDVLEDGDTLFFSTFNSVGAWIIMYGTSSQVSHVGMYLNGQRILHMVPPELTIEPISNCFDKNIRILPAKIGDNTPKNKKDTNLEEYANNVENKKYGYITVAKKALQIITGRHFHYFRWKFFIDISLFLIAIDIPIIAFTGKPFFSFLILLYLLAILTNAMLWKFKPLNPNNSGAPVDAFGFIEVTNGMILGDAYAIKGQNHNFPIYRAKDESN